jgi:sugar/nucleoside kinase (ribokinase family)
MNLWIDIARDELVEALGRVDLLFLNDEEAMQLTGERGIRAAVGALKAMGPRSVVVKKGEHGAVLFADDDDAYVQPTVILDSVVDPTGAGDAFAGGFLGHVARAGDTSARTLRQAMVQGTVTASFTAESFGPDRLVELSDDVLEGRRQVLARISAWPFP